MATVKNILEQLGLDWIVALFRKPNFEDSPLPYPSTITEVRSRFGDLWDEEKLDDALSFCSDLFSREDERLDKIESKAFTLMGVTGIAAGFIMAFAGLLFDWKQVSSTSVMVVASILFASVAVSLILTIYLATKVVTLGDYRLTSPSANDIFKLNQSDLRYVKRERAISLFFSFVQNVRVVNRKATYLIGAQLWFRNSIVLLLVTTLFLALVIPLSATSSNGVSDNQVGVPTATTTPTSTIVPTSTVPPTRIPTNTPTPTFTVTATPTLTRTPTIAASPTMNITVNGTPAGLPTP